LPLPPFSRFSSSSKDCFPLRNLPASCIYASNALRSLSMCALTITQPTIKICTFWIQSYYRFRFSNCHK
jgi:hypothetical protein